MTTLPRAFEAKYAHDKDLNYHLVARRDKLFAQQAAERLEMSERTAGELVTAVLALRHGSDHDDLLIKYMTDVFADHGRTDAADGLFISLDACEEDARQQLLAHRDGE